MVEHSALPAPEIGIRLADSAPLIRAVKALMVRNSRLLNPEEGLPSRDRVTVYLSNHGPMFAPMAAPVLTVDHLLQLGGYDDLIAVTLFHRLIEVLPGASSVLHRYFGHSTRELHSLPGLVRLMREKRFHIIGTSPEGAGCVMDYPEEVGPFTKSGLIVAALSAGADIVLTAQKGVEVFGRSVRLPGGLSLPLAGRPRGLILPVWSPGLRADVRIQYRRHRPRRTPEEIEAASPALRRALLEEEIALIHAELLDLYRATP